MEITGTEIDIILKSEGEGEDKIYSIRSVQIPNVVTQGKTIEEAKEMLHEALELYFEEVPEEKERIIKTIKAENPPLISRMLL